MKIYEVGYEDGWRTIAVAHFSSRENAQEYIDYYDNNKLNIWEIELDLTLERIRRTK